MSVAHTRREREMKAKTAVKRFGDALISCTIRTEAMGEWHGGLAKVTEIFPDKENKEIVIQVKGSQGEIGIFADENIEIV